MAKSLKVAYQHLPKDVLVEIVGLGVFKNNTTTEVSDDQFNFWLAMNRHLDTGDFGDTVELPFVVDPDPQLESEKQYDATPNTGPSVIEPEPEPEVPTPQQAPRVVNKQPEEGDQ